jgi:hypothetical protein
MEIILQCKVEMIGVLDLNSKKEIEQLSPVARVAE